MKLQRGTYARERDGAWHLYHSDTKWNDPVYGLHAYLDDVHAGRRPSSLYVWRKVKDQEERNAVREYLNGELLPGEYVEVGDEEKAVASADRVHA